MPAEAGASENPTTASTRPARKNANFSPAYFIGPCQGPISGRAVELTDTSLNDDGIIGRHRLIFTTADVWEIRAGDPFGGGKSVPVGAVGG